MVLKLLHALGGDEHLGSEIPTAEGLGDLEEPPPGVLLEVHMILLLVPVHYLGQQLALLQVVGVDTVELIEGVDELIQLVVKHLGGGESHQDLILPAFVRNLDNLEESASLVLRHVEVELLGIEDHSPGGQVSLLRLVKRHFVWGTILICNNTFYEITQ